MRVISNKRLVDFSTGHPDAAQPLQAWRKAVEASEIRNFAAMRALFNSVDSVGEFHVFDISGNKYRLVAAVHYNRQMLFVRQIFTHKEYDRWKP
jgi:mRNA interferase HigB